MILYVYVVNLKSVPHFRVKEAEIDAPFKS